MIFHTPDVTQSRLASCFKRAVLLGKNGTIESNHPLSAMWSNVCLMLDARENNNDALEMAYDIVLLDYAAEKIDTFSKTHLLVNDATVSAILDQWMSRLCFVPVPALVWFKNQKGTV